MQLVVRRDLLDVNRPLLPYIRTADSNDLDSRVGSRPSDGSDSACNSRGETARGLLRRSIIEAHESGRRCCTKRVSSQKQRHTLTI